MPRRSPALSRRSPSLSELCGRGAAVLAGIAWAWAAALSALREHRLLLDIVDSPSPPAWGVIALPPGRAIFIVAAAAALAWAAFRAGRARGAAVLGAPTAWLLAAWLIPLADLLRLAGIPLSYTQFEPLLLAGVTGAAAGSIASGAASRAESLSARSPRLAPAIVVMLAAAACIWWIHQGVAAFHDYMLGYSDFAQFGWRIANTWAGRGFMMETPGLPAFWDHFNPAVALLAPLWGLTHDVRFLIVVQAASLSLPALFVYMIVRRWGGGAAAACVWAAAYLLFPAVGQLNLNYSYGWHPVSVAMVLFLAAILALLAGRRTISAALAAFACLWQEDVALTLAWFCVVMMLAAWMNRLSRRKSGSSAPADVLLAESLPPWAWLLAAAILMLWFVTICQLAPFAQFQGARFSSLGETPLEIVLSPVLRPQVFWGNVFRRRAACFILALAVPLGLASLLRGWKTFLATAMPLAAIVAWDYEPATSIMFQYHTMALPVLFVAAISGAAAGGGGRRSAACADTQRAAPTSAPAAAGLWTGGIIALAASVSASLWLGALPWSCPTMGEIFPLTYPADTPPRSLFENRRAGSPANAALEQIVARVGRKDVRVLATGRIAAHLLMVERLEPVGTARNRWGAFAAQAGPDRAAVELFDWVVLDQHESFYQSDADIQFVASEAANAGFALVASVDGILVFKAPERRSDAMQ